MSESSEELPLSVRLWFAIVCSFKVLFDGRFAQRAWSVRDGMPELPAPPSEPRPEPKPKAKKKKTEPVAPAKPPQPDGSPALVLLALLQREGRLVDFLQQDIASFEDGEVGAAARVVHEGCRKALAEHGKITPVRSEAEESRVAVTEGVDSGAIKLTGNVSGQPPYRGVLRHRGWRLADLELPSLVAGRDPTIIAPAEVEL